MKRHDPFTCPHCGAPILPGEHCTCRTRRALYCGYLRRALRKGRVPDTTCSHLPARSTPSTRHAAPAKKSPERMRPRTSVDIPTGLHPRTK